MSPSEAGEQNPILSGKAPTDRNRLRRLTVALDPLTDFWTKQYLDTYIPAGGSKIKFITGYPGSGKTHFASIIRLKAEEKNYLTVSFSAKNVWLHDFRNIYLEIVRQCHPEQLLSACAEQVARRMGYDPAGIPPGGRFVDLLAEQGENDAMNKKTIRDNLREMFTRNTRLDHTFAQACSLLTGGILGHPVLENSHRQVLLNWLTGDETLKASLLRAAGLTPVKITKYNARHLLRSLCEVIRMAGKPGLMVIIDDLEVLLNRGSGEAMRYTKTRRDDTYESIRELIDDIDSLRNVMFLLCFDRELMDQESIGMKSYQALWLRIQNEVMSTRFNAFADIVDMDRYGEEHYTPEALANMSIALAEELKKEGITARPLSAEQTRTLKERAAFGQLGLPYMMNRMTLEGGKDNG